MSAPAFIIGHEQRTLGGSLAGNDLQQVVGVLRRGGYVLLPSDTCYSMATLPNSEGTRNNVNTLLGRPDTALSLAFSSIPATRDWIAHDRRVEIVLGSFCPGPITVICYAIHNEQILPRDFFELGISVHDRTIGVRVPDSIIERDVAGATDHPVTTVAVRTAGYTDAVRDFNAALDIVSSGTAKIGNPEWCAVEGVDFYHDHSTIIRIPGKDGLVDLFREGDIPFANILEILKGEV